MKLSTLAIDTVPLPERAVRVRIPAKAAFQLKDFQQTLVNLAERLGCPECLSGVSCLFSLETEFVVDPADLAVRGIGEKLGGR